MTRDEQYENENKRHRDKMLRILGNYADVKGDFTETELLAVERALQVYIEAFIGYSRYYVGLKFDITVTKSREALEELVSRELITQDDYRQLMKIVGFRNVLVHDYLDINLDIVMSIVKNKQYKFLENIITTKLR